MSPSNTPPPEPPRQPRGILSNAHPHPKQVAFRNFSPSRLSMDHVNENSPLIRPTVSTEGLQKIISPIGSDDDDEWPVDAEEETKSTLYLFLLTLGGLGLQIAWSVETSYGSPYLLSLGISKSMLALVWIAGPLSGVLVQPYVGMKSDNCRVRWGKRRPFIVGGAFATIVSLMILAWAREIIEAFLGIFGAQKDSQFVLYSIMCFAVLFVYVLDFAINVIQAGIRAYMVDCTPTHQQESANAWMIRCTGAGNIAGYLAGNINLPQYLPWLGGTQFKVLCAIASFVMAVTVAISCSAVRERDPQFDMAPEEQDGLMAFFKSLFRSVRKLPPQIQKVCQVQLFAWIGWFPFLFYITTYIGQLYVDPYFEKNPNMSDAEIDQLWEDATRVGARALLIFAITTFLASVFLPFVIPPTYEAPMIDQGDPTPLTPSTPRSSFGGGYFAPRTPTAGLRTPTTARLMGGSGYFPPTTPTTPMGGSGYFAIKTDNKPRAKKAVMSRLDRYLGMLQIKSLTLRRSWLLSHLIFAGLMALTFLVRGPLTATILVAFIGVPWALTNWAPFALISSEISKRDAIQRGLVRPTSRDSQLVADREDEASDGTDQAGVILGIHNVAIAAPQVIATLVSSVIFRALQKPRGTPGDNSVAWVLRFGGLCALAAAYMTTRVKEEKEGIEED
ncbi:hypothetical protein P154DRAFT_519261 [Amniculicola lignicola CBS 123094]|uniref:MFS general substrate transporter n=1 Tax=Amniculicola lignicola CBS 123094 TaxID=1392246 RepID=A0A6A5WUJ4_9PLEO|nr:hypothetical protein P154DRAFT_519261 [Amniculicola lignicola CBS 123094]